MLILLGVIAALSFVVISGTVAGVLLVPVATHVARAASDKVADCAPVLHAQAVAALARLRAHFRPPRAALLSARLLRGPPEGSRGAWAAGMAPCVEDLLHATSIACDLDRLRFRDPNVCLALPLVLLAPVIGMQSADILELRGVDDRGKPWARAYRIGDDIELPPRPPKRTPFAPSVASASIQREGNFVANITDIARAWSSESTNLAAVAPFVLRDAIERADDTFEKLLVGHSSDCAPQGHALGIHVLATDLSVSAIEFKCQELHSLN
jgi:hypothetical protein